MSAGKEVMLIKSVRRPLGGEVIGRPVRGVPCCELECTVFELANDCILAPGVVGRDIANCLARRLVTVLKYIATDKHAN